MTTTTTEAAACGDTQWSVTDWLARFEAVGGFITPNNVGWQIAGRTEDEQCAARCIYREIDSDDERMEQVHAFARSDEQVARYLTSFASGD